MGVSGFSIISTSFMRLDLDVFLLLFYCILASVSPTFGGTNPGLRAELIHSVKEQLNLICGCSFMTHPSAFASISVSYYLCQVLDFWSSHLAKIDREVSQNLVPNSIYAENSI